jgi:hypothetical protein
VYLEVGRIQKEWFKGMWPEGPNFNDFGNLVEASQGFDHKVEEYPLPAEDPSSTQTATGSLEEQGFTIQAVPQQECGYGQGTQGWPPWVDPDLPIQPGMPVLSPFYLRLFWQSFANFHSIFAEFICHPILPYPFGYHSCFWQLISVPVALCIYIWGIFWDLSQIPI